MKLLPIVVLISVSSCFNTNSKVKVEEPSTNETRFKAWLADTLSTISMNKVDYSRVLNVAADSLFLDIRSYYKLKLSQEYDGKNKDLLYAIDLLERNDNIPKDNFMLELEIHHYYTPSMVPQLVYDFDSEISKFNVKYGDSSFAYRFIKGNLIEKKPIVKTNH